MSKKRTKQAKTSGAFPGGNLIVLLGLPRDTLAWLKRELAKDTSLRPARYVGAPASRNDWRILYNKDNIAETLHLIANEALSFTPHRIIVLYVPSRDSASLISALDFVCFLAPLIPDNNDPSDGSAIGWRHRKSTTRDIVYRTLQQALKVTNALKAEITDRRISAFTLPSHNFYYPNSHSTISDSYHDFALHAISISDLKDTIIPSRFTRDQLPNKAFKSQQYTSAFFQDCRGRVFPPDLYHAKSRLNETLVSGLSLVLRQRYRFGVTVRNGNLHYDVQYELPRKLQKEPMYCAVMGDVVVTGSHANIGVNDVVWVPGGRKESPN